MKRFNIKETFNLTDEELKKLNGGIAVPTNELVSGCKSCDRSCKERCESNYGSSIIKKDRLTLVFDKPGMILNDFFNKK